MDCRHFDDYISPYLDQSLERQDREEFEKHLNECAECRENLQETRKMISILSRLDEEPLPEGFRENLYKRLEERRALISPYSLKWIGAIAGIIILLFAIKVVRDINLAGGVMEETHIALDMAVDSNSIADTAADVAPHSTRGEDNAAVGSDRYSVDNPDGNEKEYAFENRDESDKESYKGEDIDLDNEVRIESDLVELYVQDICITPQTLQFVAINNELELLESDEESVLIEIRDDEQRKVLYKELSKMGEIKDIGQNIGDNRVRIVIKNKGDQ